MRFIFGLSLLFSLLIVGSRASCGECCETGNCLTAFRGSEGICCGVRTIDNAFSRPFCCPANASCVEDPETRIFKCQVLDEASATTTPSAAGTAGAAAGVGAGAAAGALAGPSRTTVAHPGDAAAHPGTTTTTTRTETVTTDTTTNPPDTTGTTATRHPRTGSDTTRHPRTGADTTGHPRTGTDTTRHPRTGTEATRHPRTGTATTHTPGVGVGAATTPHAIRSDSRIPGTTTNYADGTRVTVRPDGGKITVRPDGTTITTRPDGITTTTRPDGTTTTTRPDAATTIARPSPTRIAKTREKRAGGYPWWKVLIWCLVGLAAAALLATGIYYLIRFFKHRAVHRKVVIPHNHGGGRYVVEDVRL